MSQMNSYDSPNEVYDLMIGYWKSGILKAAIELDVFTKIASGNNTAEKMASSLGVRERGVRILLDALCGLKLLSKENGTYFLCPLGENFLVSTKDSYVGDAVKAFIPSEDWEILGRISEAIKRGGPLKARPRDPRFWEDVVKGLIPQGIPVAKTLCDLVQIREGERKGWKVFDLACGSGVYGYTVLQRDPLATVTDLDLENVLKIAEKVARAMGISGRVTYQTGDILTSDYGASKYDLVIASHILQAFDPDTIKTTLRKVYRALVPHGTIVIHDFVPDEERSQKGFPLLFAVYMFLLTPGGGTYTFSEFSQWLTSVGFHQITLHDLPDHSSLIIGHTREE